MRKRKIKDLTVKDDEMGIIFIFLFILLIKAIDSHIGDTSFLFFIISTTFFALLNYIRSKK